MRRSVPTGQWITSIDAPADSGQTAARWWFDSGSVALDFAYAGGFGDGPDALVTPEQLADWIRQRFPEVDAEATDRDLADSRALQSAIATMASAASAGEMPAAEDVDVINLFAATPDIPPALSGGSRQAGRSRARLGQSLSAMAREATELFAAENAERIRECAAGDCELVFYDESRSNNRRWCSMQRCGNRAKVRAHRERFAEG
jgi:predicted RNA-binding Zn ribbon-like protein